MKAIKIDRITLDRIIKARTALKYYIKCYCHCQDNWLIFDELDYHKIMLISLVILDCIHYKQVRTQQQAACMLSALSVLRLHEMRLQNV